jgi:hypothetical protein
MNVSANHICIAKRSDTIHQQLVALVGKTVTYYRDDLLIHDANCISRMEKCEFIHLSYCSGTHLYEVPCLIENNSMIPHLFGKKRPSDIYTDNLDLLKTYFGRPEYFGYKHRFCYCDGINVRIVSQDKAISIYQKALNRVLGQLRIGLLPA